MLLLREIHLHFISPLNFSQLLHYRAELGLNLKYPKQNHH